MADNRLYIYCKHCNVGLAFAKCYADWYTTNSEKLPLFISNHSACGMKPFDVVYEDENPSLPLDPVFYPSNFRNP